MRPFYSLGQTVALLVIAAVCLRALADVLQRLLPAVALLALVVVAVRVVWFYTSRW